MRIALINPIARRVEGYHTIGSRIPPLGLQVLAQLVPAGHRVEIIDEVFGSDDTERLLTGDRYDLVGMTGYTSGAPRAYELAALCRKRGIPAIFGGPHAWACPDEAAGHFDSVAVGECDDIWPGIVADAAAGRLKQRYTGGLAELAAGHGRAAQGLHPVGGSYDVSAIQTSRGCPCGCEFCSVTRFNGPQVRRRPIGDFIDEWNSTDRNFVFVVDDNFYGVGPAQAEWAKQLLRAIIKHGKRRLWFSQTTVNMGGDIEGLRLAHKAGCRGMLVGLESFNPESLKSYHKGLNRSHLNDYRRLIKGFHRGGLAVFGAFIVGADQDDEDTVSETILKAVQIGIDTIQVTNLTPLPGTKMYDRFLAEGRITATDYPRDWERYSFTETVFTPKGMTAHEMDASIFELRRAAAERRWILTRTLKTLWDTRSLTTALFIHGMNKGWARMARIQVPRDAARFADLPADNPRTRRIHHALAFRCALGAAPPGSPQMAVES